MQILGANLNYFKKMQFLSIMCGTADLSSMTLAFRPELWYLSLLWKRKSDNLKSMACYAAFVFRHAANGPVSLLQNRGSRSAVRCA